MAQSHFGDDLVDIVILGAVLFGGYLLVKKMSGSSAISLQPDDDVGTDSSGGIVSDLEGALGIGTSDVAGSATSDLFDSDSDSSGGFPDDIDTDVDLSPVDTDLSDVDTSMPDDIDFGDDD